MPLKPGRLVIGNSLGAAAVNETVKKKPSREPYDYHDRTSLGNFKKHCGTM